MAAFQMFQTEFTFGEMSEKADQFGSALLAMGLQPGDAVAVWGPNQPEWLVMKWACARAGMKMVNINPMYTARELEYALNKVDARMLVCPRGIGPLDYEQVLKDMIPNLDTQNKFNLNASNVPLLNKIVFYFNNDEPVPFAIDWEEFGESSDSSTLKKLKEVKVDAHSTANIQFTSGTTGMPKAAALSHFNLVNNAISSANYGEGTLNSESSILNVLPLYHVFSFVGGSLVSTHLKIPSYYPAPGFSSAASILTAEDRKPSHLLGTPTMFVDMINDPLLKEHDISSLQYAIVGGAPVTPSLIRKAQSQLGIEMAVGYGMTENSCGTFLTPPGASEDVVANTVGLPYPGIEAKIIDENENTLRRNEVGELVTRGYMVFQGYVKDEAKTEESFTKDRFWKTGDLALVRDDGTLKIMGRSKDMIIRGGENIQPTEIENFLTTHTKIKDAYVIGVPSARLGEEVCAYVQLIEGETVSDDEIKNYALEGLAKYKVPKYVKAADEFPMTVTGKVKKFELRKMAMKDFPELEDELK